MIESPKHHLYRDVFKRFVEALRHLLPDVQEHEVKEEGRIELELDPISRGFPEVREIKYAFGDQERIFYPPAPPIQLTNVTCGELHGIKDVGEIAIPLAAPQY